MIHPNNQICKNFEEAQKTITSGQVWSGERKKSTKEGKIYFTFSVILPIFNNNGKIKKYIEFATLTTKYKSEILMLKKQILSIKSENFKTSRESKQSESLYKGLSEKYQKQVDDTVDNAQRVSVALSQSEKRNRQLEEKLKEQEKRFENFQSFHYEEVKKFASQSSS